MNIYRVTTSAETGWGDNYGVIVRAIDNLEAIELAITDPDFPEHPDGRYGAERWSRDNCSAERIHEQGKSEIILIANHGE